MATYQQQLDHLNQVRNQRLEDLKVSGPNVWVEKGKKISITVMSYGRPSMLPFERGNTFSIRRTNSEAERARLMFNYPNTPPADDGYTYYICCNLNKRFQGCINVYVTKGDAATLTEKFKSLPAWAVDKVDIDAPFERDW
jgi:hypothetical protein